MLLDLKINKRDARRMYNDIIKFLSIAFIIHLLLFAVDNYDDLMSEFAMKIFLYLIIAIVFYHMVIKKIADKMMDA